MSVEWKPGPLFALHGKTIKGTMQMGDVYALDFTDGTHLWLTVHQDPEQAKIHAELRREPL